MQSLPAGKLQSMQLPDAETLDSCSCHMLKPTFGSARQFMMRNTAGTESSRYVVRCGIRHCMRFTHIASVVKTNMRVSYGSEIQDRVQWF